MNLCVCVQTSRELKVCGAIGPCVSLNSKGSCVSENVSPRLQIPIPPFSFSQLYFESESRHSSQCVLCCRVGDGCWWHEPVESVQSQPLHHFGNVFWGGESGKKKKKQLLSPLACELWWDYCRLMKAQSLITSNKRITVMKALFSRTVQTMAFCACSRRPFVQLMKKDSDQRL